MFTRKEIIILSTLQYLLEEMDVDTLPDGGGKLIERLTHLEEQVRLQGDKVANMVVEPGEISHIFSSINKCFHQAPWMFEIIGNYPTFSVL